MAGQDMAGQQMWMPCNPTIAWDYQAPADAVWPCAVGCVAPASSLAPADLMMADASVSAAAAAVDPGVAASHAAFHSCYFDDAAAFRGRAPSRWATAQRRDCGISAADPRKLVSVCDAETGVATLQFAPAAAEQAEDPRAGRMLEEAAPRQPVQDATTCQECGGQDPSGWQDRQNRYYCTRSDRAGPRHPDCSL